MGKALGSMGKALAQEDLLALMRLRRVPAGEHKDGQLASREPMTSIRAEDHASQLGARQGSQSRFCVWRRLRLSLRAMSGHPAASS